MKNIIFAFLAILLICSGCADDDLAPIITADNAVFGAYIRLVNLNVNEFDLADLDNSVYDYEVDFVDGNGGENVNEYRIDVSYVDNNPENGDDSRPRTSYLVYTGSDFSPSERGNLGVAVKVPFLDLLNTFGLAAENVLAGDQFQFFGVVTTANGESFSTENTSPVVQGSAFQGFFNNAVKATCPLPDDLFVGTYSLEPIVDPNGVFGGPSYVAGDVTVELVPGSTTQRQFTSGVFPAAGSFLAPTIFDFVCDRIEYVEMNSGVGCGGTILYGPYTDEAGNIESVPVDITDDSEFSVVFDLGFNDGGCGIGSARAEYRLVKK